MINPDNNNTELNEGYPAPGVKPGESLTKASLPGIYRIIHPVKKRVFFGEASTETWIEVMLIFDMMEQGLFPDCDFYEDYLEPGGKYGPEKFRCLIIDTSFKYLDPLERQKKLNQVKNDFLNKYPSYTLYNVPPFELIKEGLDPEQNTENDNT